MTSVAPKTEPAAGLLPHITQAARAMRGCTGFRAISAAAMGAMSGSGYHGIVLRLDRSGTHLQPVASTLAPPQECTLHGLLQQGPDPLQIPRVPTLNQLLIDQLPQSSLLQPLCSTLFSPPQASHISAVLGGLHTQVVTAPLRLGPRPVGLLVVLMPRSFAASTETETVGLFAEVLASALLLSTVLREVEKTQGTLPAGSIAQSRLAHALALASPTDRNELDSTLTVSLPPPLPVLQQRVLLVEDDNHLRKTTSILLTGLGYDVDSVATGEQAITLYARARDERLPFDVVLMDQNLAGHIGGVETLRILRSLDPDVRAILLSGQVCRDEARMRRAGFRQCLPKPVPLDRLQAAIEEALLAPQR